jgi:hypothetical protein
MSWVAVAVGGSALVGAAASSYAGNKAAGASKDATQASVAEQRRQFDLTREDTAPYRQVGRGALGKLSQLYGLGSITDPALAPKVGTRVYKSSDIERLLQQGLSVDDILKLGTYNPGAKVSDTQRLMQRYNLSAAQINQLQNGQFSSPAAGPGAPGAGGPAGDMSVFFESPDYRFNLAEGQRAIDNSLVARGGALSGAGIKAGVRYASGMASREFGSFYDRLANLAGIGQTGVAQSAAAGANAANNISNAYMQNGMNRGSAYMATATGVNNAVQGGIGNFMLSRYLGG